MGPGPRNAITDVGGFLVGHAGDARVKTGVSVLMSDAPFVAAVHVMGGAPGTRETDLLAPDRLVQKVDALVLGGGSALGLEAASGVAHALREMGRGYAVGDMRVPIVPAAILFDLLNGGEKDFGDGFYADLGRRAVSSVGADVAIGSVGAGLGATCADVKGGFGTASVVLPSGITVGAMVAVNAVGSPLMGGGPEFWAAPFEIGGEFGGRGIGRNDPLAETVIKGARPENTTIAIVATDADLTQAQAHRVAVAAHDGLSRAIIPSHTMFDGDLVFAAASGRRKVAAPDYDVLRIGEAAATCLSRAVARGAYAATPAENDVQPAWSQRFGG
ncbi:P1 family peptidase [Rhodovulum sp. FJ3]|uniref:P1 family peptidase n=1 Tax=Rhodovulum sp. FJ3 TaxID=3079053 RepID=UPI00293DB1B9|nr:P1 family peptidase [Rhodovulum sp. FJ3]MDV4169290.1 P1 family peptidase [Rhodovulum sp. FJ3]